MKYVPEDQQKMRDAVSALRWMVLAVIFIIVATIAQITWFVMILTENPNTKAAFVVMVGAYILHFYCKWCSDDVKPDEWKNRL